MDNVHVIKIATISIAKEKPFQFYATSSCADFPTKLDNLIKQYEYNLILLSLL
jgi:hypothetical protein